ncbi:SMI1/KNR4 family protein [Myroides odoratimimus]|uniref:SMI1/KNR4 family protein n=1 Tax=Myroides odoratimimus TaxID=76832 RepID=UPI00310180D7
MEKIFKKLGGLEDVDDGRDTTFSNKDIMRLELLLGIKLPIEYIQYLESYGIKMFSEMVLFKPFNTTLPEYTDMDKGTNYNRNFYGSYIMSFFGLYDDDVYDIFYNLKTYKNRIPPNCLPIALEDSGGLIILDLNQNNYGKIFFWDHENEWDANFYEESTKKEFTVEMSYQNMYLIGENFIDFLQRMEIVEE